MNQSIGLDDSLTDLDPQDSNPREAVGGDEEKDLLDETIRTFNEKWFHAWAATPEDHRVKFISLIKHIQAHHDYHTKVA